MNRYIFNAGTTGFHKIYLQYEDLFNNDKISSYFYLVKLEDNSVQYSLPGRRFLCEMVFHARWKNYLVVQLKNSRCFRFRFFCWLVEMLQNIEEKHLGTVTLCEQCSFKINSSTKHQSKYPKIKLKLTTLDNTVHNMEPEIKWSIRILSQMLEHLQLESVFAWLSTLGGAHSALGDYFNKNAEVAWELSMKQLYIAIKIGDPALAAHCKLFMAISLMQRGHFTTASKIIRAVSRSIVDDKRLHERRLINCCKAARVRLKYVRNEKKEVSRNEIQNKAIKGILSLNDIMSYVYQI